MRLTPMRFKEFTWPHNPEVYTVEYRRRLAVHRVPFGPCVLQDLGSVYRVLGGRGVFAGSKAYEQFQALASVFRQEGPGLLVHPVWQTERAYFASLTVTEEPLPDYVQYAFEFWEDWGGYDGGLKEQPAGNSSVLSKCTLCFSNMKVSPKKKNIVLYLKSKKIPGCSSAQKTASCFLILRFH